MPKQQKNVRRAAVSALRSWSKGQDYAESLIEKQVAKNQLSSQDRALLQAILMAVLRHRNLIDHWIGRIRQGRLDSETRDILRVGVAQLMILRIPDHAAVNETVECGRKPSRGLVNAILRKTLLLRKRFWDELEKEPLPIQYSHPEWLWKRWKKQFGLDHTVALAEWNNEPAENYVRLNPLTPLSEPLGEGFEPTSDSRFFKITGSFPHEQIRSGGVYVQDLATCSSVDLLAPQKGELVLDCCAAPGGKAGMMAGVMKNEGTIVCTDSNENRLPRMLGNFERLGVTCADVSVHDWTQPAPERFTKRFDAILADVPCSNTGVLRRRVDMKWRLKPEQFSELAELQAKIVVNLIPCLKQGGRIVYSTCSIDPEENQDQVARLLREFPELSFVKEIVVNPFTDQTDGAYAALLIKH